MISRNGRILRYTLYKIIRCQNEATGGNNNFYGPWKILALQQKYLFKENYKLIENEMFIMRQIELSI